MTMKIGDERVIDTRIVVLVVAMFAAACNATDSTGKPPQVASAPSGKALYEEKCRTVAGEKIYRKVENVEGILLLKVRPFGGGVAWADPNWPGAAFARERTGDEYISSFLEYENPVPPESVLPGAKVRGHIDPNPGPNAIAGYRYVEVIDEESGKRYRYAGRWDEPWQQDKSYLKGYIRFSLDKATVTTPAPRYAVTYDDHVVTEERARWVASSTVKVIDRETGEVLGEMLRYAWSGGGPSPASPSPWLRAIRCPDHAVGTGAATRKFVDQILIPIREK